MKASALWRLAPRCGLVLALTGCTTHDDSISIRWRSMAATAAAKVNYPTLMRIGAAAHAGGDFANAVSVYRRAAQMAPTSRRRWSRRRHAARDGQTSTRRSSPTTRRSSANAHYPEALRGLAKAYLTTGKPELAGSRSTVAYQDTPNDPKLLLLIGVADDFVGQHEEAQARYRRGPRNRGRAIRRLSLDLALSLALERAITTRRSRSWRRSRNGAERDAPRTPDPGADLRAARAIAVSARATGADRPRPGLGPAQSGLLRHVCAACRPKRAVERCCRRTAGRRAGRERAGPARAGRDRSSRLSAGGGSAAGQGRLHVYIAAGGDNDVCRVFRLVVEADFVLPGYRRDHVDLHEIRSEQLPFASPGRRGPWAGRGCRSLRPGRTAGWRWRGFGHRRSRLPARRPAPWGERAQRSPPSGPARGRPCP